jgi:TRAP-type C4-dicarboxylate transport system permease small subunit
MANPTASGPARPVFVRVMDRLYQLCMVICVLSIVCMTVLIFSGVVMRYFFSVGARYAEPMSIFFTVQLTMYGAAVCYRANAHLRLALFVDMLPGLSRAMVLHFIDLAMAAVAVLMVWYGISLTETTWFQSYPEFDDIKVGVVYSAIPGGGLVLLLFIFEKAFFREALAELEGEEMRHALELAEKDAKRLDL